MSFYERYIPIEPFFQPSVKIDQELELTPEDIAITNSSNTDNTKNMARDINDTRIRSKDNWSQNPRSGDPYQNAKDYEKQLFAEAGGAKERDEILKEMNSKKNSPNPKESSTHSSKGNNGDGNNVQYSGDVMVEFKLDNRSAYDNNMWYIRNPGYTCGFGSSGKVVVKITVDKSGKVVSATYDASKSKGTNSCMIEQSVRYAKKSKFNYSSKSPENQSGYIIYMFISQ